MILRGTYDENTNLTLSDFFQGQNHLKIFKCKSPFFIAYSCSSQEVFTNITTKLLVKYSL